MPSATIRTKIPRRRAQLSCDRCRLIKRKCSRSSPCERCVEDQEECTFERAHSTRAALLQPKKSHVVSQQIDSSASSSSSPTQSSQAGSVPSSHTSAYTQQVQEIDKDIEPADPSAILHLIAQPTFLQQVSIIYIREISWYIDMLSGTRLNRFIEERHDPSSSSSWSSLWDEIQLLALTVTALAAQTCPTDIEVALLSMNSESRHGFRSGRAISQAAYKLASSKIEVIVIKSHPQTWPSEVFASAALLRVIEKNNFIDPSLAERYLVDISRMMKAKLHQSSIYSAIPRIWQAEHDLLAYRIFWHCFVDDIIVANLTGNTCTIQPRHCNVCLHDPLGRLSIQKLCSEESSRGLLVDDCQCGSRIFHLGLFEGCIVRIAAIMGRYFERLLSARSTSFQWPRDAEQMAINLELELFTLETDLDLKIKEDANCLLPGQEDILALYIARTRRDLAKQLCDGYANHLLQGGSQQPDADPIAVEWMLNRRRYDSAKILITRAMAVPRRLSIQTTFNNLFFPKFIYIQSMELLEGVESWFQNSRNEELGWSLNWSQRNLCDYQQDYNIDCLRLAIAGRNILVLTSQKNELKAAKKFSKMVVEKCAQVLRPLVAEGVHLGSEHDIIDDGPILKAVKMHSLSSGAEKGQETLNAEDSRNFLTALFADLPALGQLFDFGPLSASNEVSAL